MHNFYHHIAIGRQMWEEIVVCVDKWILSMKKSNRNL